MKVSKERIAIRPIGRIRTPFSRANGTPIQSSAANGIEGTVELFPEYAVGLKDLDGFERVWLLYWLDRVNGPQLLVRPYLDTEERGVFATRSPSRPNQIGMSPVRLLRIDGNVLHVADVDILDGTPLLDIKPYIPAFDHFEVERIGWYRGKSVAGKTADDRFEKKQSGGEPDPADLSGPGKRVGMPAREGRARRRASQ